MVPKVALSALQKQDVSRNTRASVRARMTLAKRQANGDANGNTEQSPPSPEAHSSVVDEIAHSIREAADFGTEKDLKNKNTYSDCYVHVLFLACLIFFVTSIRVFVPIWAEYAREKLIEFDIKHANIPWIVLISALVGVVILNVFFVWAIIIRIERKLRGNEKHD